MEKYSCLECGTVMEPVRYIKIDPNSKMFEVVFACPNPECMSKN